MENYTQFVIKVVQMCIILGFLVIFIVRNKKGIKGYIFLQLTLISGFLQGLVECSFFLVEQIWHVSVNYDLFQLPIEHIFYGMFFIFLLLHFEYYLGYYFIPTIIGMIFMAITYTAYFIDLKYDLGYFSFQPVWHLGIGRLWLFIFDIYELYVLTFCLFASGVLNRSARKTKVYYQTFILHVAFVIGFISAICEVLEHFIPNFDPYGGLTFGVAFLVVFVLYLLSPSFVFYTPRPIFQFIVLHENGQIIYNFNNTLYKPASEVLIGSIIYAFQTFISEITQAGESQSLEFIKLNNRAVIAYRKQDILGIIITTNYSRLFKNSLEHFTEAFYNRFKEDIANFTGDFAKFDEADELVRKLFPYIVLRKQWQTRQN